MSGHVQDRWYSPDASGKPAPTGRHGCGRRWKARYVDPDGQERSRSFTRKAEAERFLTEVEHSKIAGSYLDPDAGRVKLASRVPLWLATLTSDPTTRHHVERRVSRHILRNLGDRRLDTLARSPSLIQAWVAALPVAPAYAQQLLSDLSAILDQAVADRLIPTNPCRSAPVRAPRAVRRKLVPWSASQISALRTELPDRYQAVTDAGGGLGLRQGEIFGLSLDEIDWLHRRVRVDHQVKLYRTVTPVYGPPKGGKSRTVPLPRQVAEAISEHVRQFPAVEVTLPWQSPEGAPRTFALVFTGENGGACNRSAFNTKVWGPARRRASIPDGEGEAAGMHQLRHHYASMMLRGGVDVKRVQEWLGHHSAAFTLDVYGHLMPDDDEASLRQIEAILDAATVSNPIARNLKEL